MWNKILKNVALLVIAGIFCFTWSESGVVAQPPCVIERGIDPLDILDTVVKHNVWIGLDNSGSMTGGMSNGLDRLDNAKLALTAVVSAVGDQVNWGFFYSAYQKDDGNGDYGCAVPLEFNSDGGLMFAEGDTYDFNTTGRQDDCVGPDEANKVLPLACSEQSTKDIILEMLQPDDNSPLYDEDLHGDGGIDHGGGTANAPTMDAMATEIANNYMGPGTPAGQKNIIIYISDGNEDCVCDSGSTKSQLPVGHPGYEPIPPAPKLRSSPSNPETLTNVGNDNDKQRGYNAGIVSRHALSRIDPNLDGSQGDIFIALFGDNGGEDEQCAHNWAWEASGYGWTSRGVCPPGGGLGCARPARVSYDQTDLIEFLQGTLTTIGVPETSVSFGAGIPGSVKEVIPSHTAPSCVSSLNDLVVSGPGDNVPLSNRHKYKTNVLFTTSVDTPDFEGHLKAYNIYTATCDGAGTETGRASDFSLIWDAGDELRDRDISSSGDPRKILFNRDVAPGTTPPAPLDFNTANITAADLGVTDGYLSQDDPLGMGVTAAEAVTLVVNLIHGWRLVVSSDPDQWIYKSTSRNLGDFNFTQLDGAVGTWKLFDATNSAPAVVLNPPRSPEFDPPQPSAEYRDFYYDYANRMTMIYLGTNGGMIHGFQGDSGREVFAYIPSDLLPRLPDLVQSILQGIGVGNHQYFVAASPVVEDVYLQPSSNNIDEWRSVLTFGRGPGGKFLTALDVTEIGDFDQSLTPDPKLLWNVGNRDFVADLDPTAGGNPDMNYDGLGETWSIPVMGRLDIGTTAGQWVTFAASGYGCPGTEEGKFFYVIKLEDGTIYEKLGIPSPDLPGGIKDAVEPGDPGIDENAMVATPALYNPYMFGSNISTDFVKRAYIGDLQGFVYKLDCSQPNPNLWTFDVFFEVTSEADQGPGQGDHNQPITAGAAILKLSGTDKVWIFLGTGGDSRVELTEPDRFKFVGLEDIDPGVLYPGDFITTQPSGDPFFFDLNERDRVTVPLTVAQDSSFNGVVYVAASRAMFDQQECAHVYRSTLYAAGAESGLGGFDLDPSQAGDQSQVDLGEGKVTGLFHRDEHLYVSKSGGINAEAETEIRGKNEFKPPAAGAGSVNVVVTSFRLSPF